MRRPSHHFRWLLGAVVLAAVLVVGGAYTYIHVIEGDPPTQLSAATTAPSAVPAGSTVAGTWTVSAGSQAGYRVGEVLAGQSTTAVGRTDAVTGSLTATATQVTAGSFTVDLTKVSSDQSRRDAQFQGRIMQTSQYPSAVFTLTSPVDLGALGTAAGTSTIPVTGTLAMHGATRPVTVPLTVVRSGETVTISGQIPVVFADYGINNPSVGGFVTTDDHGTVEVLLKLAKG